MLQYWLQITYLRQTIMKIGYARVSTTDQDLSLQLAALNKANCENGHREEESGAKFDRPVFLDMLNFARPGDAIVVWKLDRLGRSLRHLIDTVNDLKSRGIDFVSLTENIDTTTAAGTFVFHIFAAQAEFERNLIRERTMAGLASARARGRVGGRKKVLTDKKAKLIALHVKAFPEESVSSVCREHEISRAGYYRSVHPLVVK
jgi:DNA invertase Pin-like site-specific DNA recombinase